MSNDIATISLRVNTSELERGNQALDRFQETASAAAGKADDLNSTFRTGIDNQKKNSESLKQQRQELQNLLNKISPVNKALDELDTIQGSLAKFRGKGLVGDEDFTRYNSVLETTRAKLAQVMESETAEGRARIEQTQAAQRAVAAGKTFIDSLEEQVTTIGKTRAELLELKAAQLGVSDRAAPMIAKLKEQEEAWKSGAVSAGQYRNAMRYLPMQMTDIVTSLASGMPVYMVAIQQGGQLRDSFGGVGNECSESDVVDGDSCPSGHWWPGWRCTDCGQSGIGLLHRLRRNQQGHYQDWQYCRHVSASDHGFLAVNCCLYWRYCRNCSESDD